MVKKRHLTLVYSNDCQKDNREKGIGIMKDFFDNLSFIFVSQNKKIETLRGVLLNMYRDYEITSGKSEIPYYLRTENKINQIIQEGKINYYYKKLRKFQNYMKTL